MNWFHWDLSPDTCHSKSGTFQINVVGSKYAMFVVPSLVLLLKRQQLMHLETILNLKSKLEWVNSSYNHFVLKFILLLHFFIQVIGGDTSKHSETLAKEIFTLFPMSWKSQCVEFQCTLKCESSFRFLFSSTFLYNIGHEKFSAHFGYCNQSTSIWWFYKNYLLSKCHIKSNFTITNINVTSRYIFVVEDLNYPKITKDTGLLRSHWKKICSFVDLKGYGCK